MRALARQSDPNTSHIAAAKHNHSGRAKTNGQRVYDLVAKYPNHTGRELTAKQDDLDYHEIVRRLNQKRIVKGKARICSISGNLCATWRAAD